MTCANLAAALAIQPRIADVRDRNLVVVEQGGDHGRAHAFAFGLGARGLIDDLVGARDGVAQDDGRTGEAGGAIERAEILARETFAHQVGDGLDGDAAGNFAGVVSAHAIGEH